MRSPESRAREVAERLTAATGTQARTTTTRDTIRVEVDVPVRVDTELLAAIVAALGGADRFGHDHTANAAVAWAEIARPATAGDDREGNPVRVDPQPRAAGDEEPQPPGQPWEPPQEPPSPDGSSPEGDGKHRK